MNRILTALILLTVNFSVAAGINDKNFGNTTIDEIASIYDADTFRANIKAWPPIIGERISIRINGVDAPEIRGKCDNEKKQARDAKQFTVGQLRNATKIELRNIKRGKYFRILADVFVDGNNLAQLLINNNLARPYDGGTRLGWCD